MRSPSASLPACASRQTPSAAAARSRAAVQAASASAAPWRAAFAVASASSAAVRAVARSLVAPTSALRRRTSSAAASRSAAAASTASRAAAASAAASTAQPPGLAGLRGGAALSGGLARRRDATRGLAHGGRLLGRAQFCPRPGDELVATGDRGLGSLGGGKLVETADGVAAALQPPLSLVARLLRLAGVGRRLGGSEGEAVAALRQILRALRLGLPQRLGALRRQAGGCVAQPLGRVLERQLERRVVAGVEQRPEDLLALLGVGLEQLLEAALWQHDDLAELLGAEAQELLGPRADLRPAGLQRPTALFRPAVTVAQPPERGRLVVLRDAVSLELRALLLGLAHDPEELGAEREVERHSGEELGIGVVAAHGRSGAPAFVLRTAAGDAVEGERHGVEDGGLARARGSGDEEEARAAQLGEVESLLAGVGAERLHDDAQRSHGAASRRRRSSVSMTPVSASRRASPSSPSVT